MLIRREFSHSLDPFATYAVVNSSPRSGRSDPYLAPRSKAPQQRANTRRQGRHRFGTTMRAVKFPTAAAARRKTVMSLPTDGVLYTVPPFVRSTQRGVPSHGGELLWHRYVDQHGRITWDHLRTVGTGWSEMNQVFDGRDGIVYFIEPVVEATAHLNRAANTPASGGRLMWARHVGHLDGTFRSGRAARRGTRMGRLQAGVRGRRRRDLCDRASRRGRPLRSAGHDHRRGRQAGVVSPSRSRRRHLSMGRSARDRVGVGRLHARVRRKRRLALCGQAERRPDVVASRRSADRCPQPEPGASGRERVGYLRTRLLRRQRLHLRRRRTARQRDVRRPAAPDSPVGA